MQMIRFIKNILTFIRNPKENFSERVFVLFTLISEIAVAVALTGNLIVGENIYEILVLVGILVIVPIITFVGLHFNRIDISGKIIVIGLVFLVLPSLFFFGGGTYGGGVLWFIFTFLYVGLALSGRWRNTFLVLVFVVSGTCYLIEYYHPEYVFPHSREMFYIDSFLSIVLVGMVCFFMVMFQNRIFIQETRLAKEEAKAAEELNRSQNRFFSSMSHEIRTPINSILGLNELILRESSATDEIIRDANGIAGSGKMLLALINDILDFSKIEAGSMDIIPVDYQVGSLLSEIVNMIWIKAEDKGLKLDVSIDPGIPSVLYGDEVRIKQILINLLNNAVKYTKEGSVGIHMECEEIDEEEILLLISVSDTGMGIKSDSIPYLFDAFKRVDEQNNRHIEGTGLGLSIVKQLIDLMGGEITVNSKYGEGSTFNVTIRQGISDSTKIGDLSIHNYGTAKRSSHESAFMAPDAAILIVDDNEMNLEVEKKLLADTKMRIDTALSGKRALELTVSHRYDAILMDHLMPEMDGIECLEAIRSQIGGLNNYTPVIVLTANAGSENRRLYNAAGFDSYLVKPVSGDDLEDMLMTHIRRDKLIIKDRKMTVKEDKSATRGYSRKAPFVIAASSMVDMPDALMNDPKLPIIPFVVKTERGIFKDYYQIDSDEMVRCLRKGEKAVSSPMEVADYVDFFAENLKNAHQLIYIAITTSMSKDYIIASEAAKSFDNVTVINSEVLSSATGILVMIAYKLAQQDITLEEIVSELETVKKRLKCGFIIDTTEFMAARGLIGKNVSNLLRSLSLRPALRFRNDKSGIGGIWIGSRRHAYHRYIKSAFPADIVPDEEVVFVTYVDVPEDTLMWIKEEIDRNAYFENVVFQKASAAVSSNCGPGTFGVLYLAKGNKSYNIASLFPKEEQLEDEETESATFAQPDDGGITAAQYGTGDKAAAQYENAISADKQTGNQEKKWYEDIEGIDGDVAIKNSGSEDSFKTVLKIFYDAIDDKSGEIQGFYDNEDWNDYVIKVHALKSSSKLIGAISLSEKAEALEMAGKGGDIDYIRQHHQGLIEQYLEYKDKLKDLYSDDTEISEDKIEADSFLMESVYEAIANAAKDMDIDAVEEAFNEIADYAIPESEKEKTDAIKEALNSYDYDTILEILGVEE